VTLHYARLALGAVALLALAGCATNAARHAAAARQTKAPSTPSTIIPGTTSPVPTIPTKLSAHLSASSAVLIVGGAVTISGSGCVPGHWGTAALDESTESDFPDIFHTAGGGYDAEGLFGTNGGGAGGALAGAKKTEHGQ
jgi:hypothetical protein